MDGRPERNPAPRGRPATILVVEDEEGIRVAVRRYLEGRGYRVLEAEDPEEALEVAQSAAGPVDILFEEIVAPDSLGGRLADAVRVVHPELSVIYTSGRAPDDPLLREAVDEGTPFLRKPFSPTRLVEVIEDVLAAG